MGMMAKSHDVMGMMANRHEGQKDFSDSRIAFSTENDQNMHK